MACQRCGGAKRRSPVDASWPPSACLPSPSPNLLLLPSQSTLDKSFHQSGLPYPQVEDEHNRQASPCSLRSSYFRSKHDRGSLVVWCRYASSTPAQNKSCPPGSKASRRAVRGGIDEINGIHETDETCMPRLSKSKSEMLKGISWVSKLPKLWPAVHLPFSSSQAWPKTRQYSQATAS